MNLRDQALALYQRLPARWRTADGSEVWKNQRFANWLAKQPDEALPELLVNFQETLAYLKANPKAKLSDPYVKRRSRANLATLKIMLQRTGQNFAKWMRESYPDPAELATCRADVKCMINQLEEYLDRELGAQVRADCPV